MYEETRAIVNCCHNILNGNIKLTKRQERKLRKYRGQMKRLVNPSTSLRAKRHMLNQRGGFIGTLLSVALPALTGVISSLINK